MPSGVTRAGFVLAGGSSSRMGCDKALLPYGDGALVEHVARQVRTAAGSVVLVGPPERYSALGFPVIGDLHPGLGPLGGIETALASSSAVWNLIVACDMPSVTSHFLDWLLREAERAQAPCVVPQTPDGKIHPLCAVYHLDVLPAIREALDSGVRKAGRMASALGALLVHAYDSEVRNTNTPGEWAAL